MFRDDILIMLRLYYTNCLPTSLNDKIQKWMIMKGYELEKEKASFDFWENLKSENDEDVYSAFDKVKKIIWK